MTCIENLICPLRPATHGAVLTTQYESKLAGCRLHDENTKWIAACVVHQHPFHRLVSWQWSSQIYQTTLQHRTADLGAYLLLSFCLVCRALDNRCKSTKLFTRVFPMSPVFSLLNVHESYLCHVEEGKKNCIWVTCTMQCSSGLYDLIPVCKYATSFMQTRLLNQARTRGCCAGLYGEPCHGL